MNRANPFQQSICTATLLMCALLVGCEKKEIRVAHFAGPPESRLIDSERKTFEQELGIAVDFNPLPYDVLRAQLPQSLRGKPEFDVIFVDDIWLREFQEEGWLLNLTPFVRRNLSSDFGIHGNFLDYERSDYPINILKAEAFAPNDTNNIWLVPHRADVQVLFFNKSIFDSPDVQLAYRTKARMPLRVPETWEEYENVATNISGLIFNGRKIVGCAETLREPHFAFEFFACRFWSMTDAKIRNTRNFFFAEFDTSDQPLFASRAGVSAIHHFQTLLSFAGCVSQNSLVANHDTTREAFGKGDVALCPQWYTFYTDLDARLKRRGMELGATLIPGTRQSDEGILRCPSLGGGGLGIPSTTKNPKEAWAFIRYFTREAFSEKSAQQGAVVPRKSSYKKLDVKREIPALDVYLESLNHAVPRPRVARFIDVETIIGQSVVEAITHDPTNSIHILQRAAVKSQDHIKRAKRN